MALGGLKLGVHPFVGEVEHEGSSGRLLVEPLNGVVGQLIGDISFLGNPLAIDIESVAAGEIRALPFETDPVIKATLGIIDLSPHMPFPNHRRAVAG